VPKAQDCADDSSVDELAIQLAAQRRRRLKRFGAPSMAALALALSFWRMRACSDDSSDRSERMASSAGRQRDGAQSAEGRRAQEWSGEQHEHPLDVEDGAVHDGGRALDTGPASATVPAPQRSDRFGEEGSRQPSRTRSASKRLSDSEQQQRQQQRASEGGTPVSPRGENASGRELDLRTLRKRERRQLDTDNPFH
jgi:hypothetical protein